MTTVTCVLHEAVVLREHGICLQLVGLDPERAQVAVADLPAREGADDAATRRLRRCKERLKGRMHAAAEALQALHVQLEEQPEADAEPLILRVYRELRDADRELDWIDRLADLRGAANDCCAAP